MDATTLKSVDISPVLVHRSCGGWLAVAPKGAFLSIAVTAPTEDDARNEFRTELAKWVRILQEGYKTADT